jgi:hypothetical protein
VRTATATGTCTGLRSCGRRPRPCAALGRAGKRRWDALCLAYACGLLCYLQASRGVSGPRKEQEKAASEKSGVWPAGESRLSGTPARLAGCDTSSPPGAHTVAVSRSASVHQQTPTLQNPIRQHRPGHRIRGSLGNILGGRPE